MTSARGGEINQRVYGCLDAGWREVCCKGPDSELVCGIAPQVYTWALMVDGDESGYERRYCYENLTDAHAALVIWDGTGHPTGPWLKIKGRWLGERVDLNQEDLAAWVEKLNTPGSGNVCEVFG